MKNFTSKVPYGWWDEFRSRAMEACGWTAEQWQNRLGGRTQLSEAERIVLENVYREIQKEFTV